MPKRSWILQLAVTSCLDIRKNHFWWGLAVVVKQSVFLEETTGHCSYGRSQIDNRASKAKSSEITKTGVKKGCFALGGYANWLSFERMKFVCHWWHIKL